MSATDVAVNLIYEEATQGQDGVQATATASSAEAAGLAEAEFSHESHNRLFFRLQAILTLEGKSVRKINFFSLHHKCDLGHEQFSCVYYNPSHLFSMLQCLSMTASHS